MQTFFIYNLHNYFVNAIKSLNTKTNQHHSRIIFYILLKFLIQINLTKCSQQKQLSLYPPVLKVESLEGYLTDLSTKNPMIRVSPEMNSKPLQILVEDKDLLPGMPPAVYQYILTGYGAEHFAVDKHGNLFLNTDNGLANLNFSTVELHVIAQEVNTVPMRSSASITLTIRILTKNSLNKNIPVFPKPLYFVNVSSSAENKERLILKVLAFNSNSEESDQIVGYRIAEVSENGLKKFRYDLLTNELYAIDSLIPNHIYKIVLEAINSAGHIGRTTIIVHSLPPSQKLLPVFYSIPSQMQQYQTVKPQKVFMYPTNFKNFTLNPEDETMQQNYLKNILLKNLETSTLYYSLNQISSQSQYLQHTLKPTDQITLDNLNQNLLNRKAIELNTQINTQTIMTELNEAIPPNSIIAVLGNDATTNKVYFQIVAGNKERKFAIDPNTGTVTTVQFIDREETNFYFLTIEARLIQFDQLLYVTYLKINVTDVNDNAPKFQINSPKFFNFKFDESENLNLENFLIGRIFVNDSDAKENGKVSLKILSPMNSLFTINDNGEIKINGDITTAHLGKNRITVIANDHGDPPLESRTHITINISYKKQKKNYVDFYNTQNKLVTILPHYNTNTKKHTTTFSQILNSNFSVLQTVDNSNKRYDYQDLIENNLKQPVSVLFNRATLPTYLFPNTEKPLFTIINTIPSTQKTIINLHSSIPFSRFTGLTSEKPNTTKKNLKNYSSIKQIHQKYFAPVFTEPIINLEVLENEKNLELCSLEAKFPEKLPTKWSNTIQYVIETGDPTFFQIDSLTGKLVLINELNAEKIKNIKLRIGTLQAAQNDRFKKSLTLAHSAEVNINVISKSNVNVNLKKNFHEFYVPKNAEPGTIIGQVTEYLEPINNNLTYAIINDNSSLNYFQIEAKTGILKVARSIKEFDGKNLMLKIKAYDNEKNSRFKVITANVNVLNTKLNNTEVLHYLNSENVKNNNINKNKFSLKLHNNSSYKSDARVKFALKNYSVKIFENIPTSSLIKRLPIIVSNNSNFKKLKCAFVSGNLNNVFNVIPNEQIGACEIYTQTELDYEKVNSYHLNVSLNLNKEIESTIVEILVLDINDNPPKFIDLPNNKNKLFSEYFAAVSSLAQPKTYIITLQANDADSNDNGLVLYSFNNNTTTDYSYFYINQNTGEIFTQKKMPNTSHLNSDTKIPFNLEVKACDLPREKNLQLCSTTKLSLYLIENSNRLITIIQGNLTTKNFKIFEKKFSDELNNLTKSCSFWQIEKFNTQYSKKLFKKMIKDKNDTITTVYWYSYHTKKKKLCNNQDFSNLINVQTRKHLNLKLQNFTVLFIQQLLNSFTVDNEQNKANKETFKKFFLPLLNWHNTLGVIVLFVISLGILIFFALFITLYYRFKHRKNQKRAKLSNKPYPGMYSISKYNMNGNSAVYLPTINSTNFNTSNGNIEFGNLVRNKFYETQMMELPIADEDFNLLNEFNHVNFNYVDDENLAYARTFNNTFSHNMTGHNSYPNNYIYQPHRPNFYSYDFNRNYNHNKNYNSRLSSCHYGTTTTTSSAGGNGSGIPTFNAAFSGKGMVRKRDIPKANASHYRTYREDSLDNASIDNDFTIHQNQTQLRRSVYKNLK